MKEKKIKKILILRFSSIGDIVLTTPVIRNLKVQLDAEIHYCTKKAYEPLLIANPYIAKLHLLDDDTGLKQLISELKKENFDFVVDLHKNLRTWRVKIGLGVPSAAFNKLNVEKWLYTNFKINRLPNVHIVERYMETVEGLGVKMDAFGLDYYIPEKDEVEMSWLPPAFQPKKYIAFAIGGQHTTKKLPINRMIELCDRINKPIVLLGGKEDFKAGEEIFRFFEKKKENEHYEEGLKELNKKTVIFNGCGKFNINQSASLIEQSQAVFSHDTGLMHIAAAFQKRVFSIWGNTTPLFGMYPYRTRFSIFENNKLSCRPCSKLGYDKCPKGHFKCMNEVVFDFYLP